MLHLMGADRSCLTRFLRIPGGCVIEGDTLALRFQWKKAIGPIAERPGHWDIWGYWNTDGTPFALRVDLQITEAEIYTGCEGLEPQLHAALAPMM